jgi:predicted dehydrogenase
MNRIKLGIIGCGIAARDLHWPALQNLTDQFEITAVCNHTEPKAKQFAQMVGDVPYVLDYHELLRRPDVEAVDIVLPIHLNYQATKNALKAGKHVIVEKPLAANLSEAAEMVEFEAKYPQVMMVAENFRYHAVFDRVRYHLAQGKIGKPYAVFWNIFFLVDSKNKYTRTQWRVDHQYPGGFILDGGIHNIALLRHLFGDIVSGIAFTKSVNPNIGEIDSMSFQFETADGVHGMLNIFLSARGFSENRFLMLGNEGSILVDGNKILIKKEDEIELEETVETDGGYQAEFEDFYLAIRQGTKVVSSFSEAYRDLEVLISALESAKTWPHI